MNTGYCSQCFGLDDNMPDCENCLGTGKEPDKDPTMNEALVNDDLRDAYIDSLWDTN